MDLDSNSQLSQMVPFAMWGGESIINTQYTQIYVVVFFRWQGPSTYQEGSSFFEHQGGKFFPVSFQGYSKSGKHEIIYIGGGFKYFLFSPLFGEDSDFDWYFWNGLKPTSNAF